MRDKVLIFGGTTEGRELAAALSAAGVQHLVSVATDYGKEIEDSFGEKNVIVGRKNADEMAELIAGEVFTVCVDATHPFATLVSTEIKKACEKTGIMYLRLLRDTGAKIELMTASNECGFDKEIESNCRKRVMLCNADVVNESIQIVTCDSVMSAAKELEKISGNILLLTGSKDLKSIMAEISDKTRVYARVIPNIESITKCEEAGLRGKQIIAMQGPFSKDMNVALINEICASVILTKESGATGGLDEKLLAARECGIKVVMIKSPESRLDVSGCDVGASAKGYSLPEVLEKLGVDKKRVKSGEIVKESNSLNEVKDNIGKSIILAGIGPGDARYYTRELEDALENVDVIFGAKSILDRLDKSRVKAEFVPRYMGKDILEFLNKSPNYKNPLALFSGDISLCSGAKNAAKVFEGAGYGVHTISGISSVALFANRLGLGLEDCSIVSAHGRECNVAGYIAETKRLIILPSSCAHAGEIARTAFTVAKINDYGRNDSVKVEGFGGCGDLKIVIGYELGTALERIFEVSEDELGNKLFSPDEKGKCLMYIENKCAGETPVIRGISDDEFIRGKTPMTKEEIRAISIRKLGLSADSVLYDIGAGTGSVSVEAALLHPDIKVCAIERNDEAVELIKKNKEKFCADNITVIKGEASEVLEKMALSETAENTGVSVEGKLLIPTHAFIGGSGGNMRVIIEVLKKMNENIRIVINCVTLETLTEVLSVIKEEKYAEPDIVQVSASRYRRVGEYHMADAINPVYIVTL
ncbi:precorrin-6Y C5,15-methyltransferase (decarboxylating) subunit CbiT [Butyrivibrio sp. M55]|uniref:precorrin-6Y C5,15-methyltransferase (decarboxylating) subunit CbiT n=1 Tax=Butyrivibrio sp. M55 TaxID=1855323 RepID=UPI0008ED4383|nr:precorrin-6Y C5,15-methyltransferase (decarboxylating) subunit CbiT [Butyrivibrio sp. M55]SFU47046.1 precorrin-6Y C5,15-methyltransferase (decarboxylating) [Butyrivibrio sp. M55]